MHPQWNAWSIGKPRESIELTKDWRNWQLWTRENGCAVQRLWREAAGIRTVCLEPGVPALGTERGAGEGWGGEEENDDIQAIHPIQG